MENMENNSKKTAVSVIMNCLNCGKYLREAIDSVFSQTYKDWEIIFWDNASTDNSAEIAKNYGQKLKYFRSDQTYSLGRARNLALEKAAGEYIAFLDCDDIWLPEKLKEQIPVFNNDSKIGLVFSDAVYFNQKGDVFQLYGKRKPPEGYVFRQLLKNYFLCLSTVAIKKKTLSGLNEWFDSRFNYVEEADLFLRIAHDWKLAYIDEVLVKYRMHRESWTFSHQYLSASEKEILIEKLFNLYPNFSKEYSQEIRVMQSEIGYRKFFLSWENDNRKKAREYLKPFLKIKKKFFLPYVLSYFSPISFYTFLLQKCQKRTYSP